MQKIFFIHFSDFHYSVFTLPGSDFNLKNNKVQKNIYLRISVTDKIRVYSCYKTKTSILITSISRSASWFFVQEPEASLIL